MALERKMAENSISAIAEVPPSGVQTSSQNLGEPVAVRIEESANIQRPGILRRILNRRGSELRVLVKPNEQQVIANASLTEEDRKRVAQQTLDPKTPLTSLKQQAIIDAHAVGANRPGAGIYRYTPAEIRQKSEILKEAGFNIEQRRTLMEFGLVGGVLRATEFSRLVPVSFTDEKVRRVATHIKNTGEAGRGNGSFFNRVAAELQRLYYAGDVDGDEALRLLNNLDGWIMAAEQPQLVRESNRFRDQYRVAGIADDAERKRLETTRDKVLTFVRQEIKRVYTDATARPTPSRDSDSWGSSSPTPKTLDERVRDVYAVLGDGENNFYKETFWNLGEAELREIFETTDVAALRRDYEGLASYVAFRTAVAIEKELKRGSSSLRVGEDVGDDVLLSIKEELANANSKEAIRRRKERSRATFKERLPYNPWRERFGFTWAENEEELRATVADWVKKFEEGLPEEAPEAVYEAAKTQRQNAISALKEALTSRLGLSEKSPLGKELRSTIESAAALIGGVALLETGEKDGFETFTKFLEDFCHNFNAHHDSVYLGNAKSAIIQDFLSENDGEISLGGPGTLEKPLAGDTEEYREHIAERAIRYASTHELYIKEQDFYEIDGETGDYRYDQKGNRIRKERYGWDDDIEELLLEDSRGMAKVGALTTDPLVQAEVIKVATRTDVFKAIKERLDKEDIYTYEASPGHFVSVSLASLNPDQRREAIRNRIREKMELSGYKKLAAEINTMTDQGAKDKALWEWLRDYNEKRANQDHSLFFPSKWDTVRLSINMPTKLVDRALSKSELRSMVELVEDPYQDLTDDQIRNQVQLEFLTQIRDEVAALTNPPADRDAEIRQRFESKRGVIKDKIDDTLFNQESRKNEAEQAFSLNRKYQKFLGVDSRWGGQVVRVIEQDGKMVLKPVSVIAKEFLKSKIDKEYQGIEAQVTQHVDALRVAGVADADIEKARVEKRRLLRRDSTFGATLALRELGIAHDLPIWDYYYYNDYSLIQAFAPLVGYTHNDKVQIVDLLDRGRREMRAVYDYLADEYMDRKILIVRDEPNTELDENGRPKSFHRENWDRKRVINEGGESMIRDILESRFMTSTSGGVEWVDAISRISDIGIYDLLWEHGCQDFREFQGFIKRRDEVELKQQSFWNTRKWRDSITYAKRLRAAGAARTFLTGGEVGGKKVPGILIEPFSGLYRYRDEFVKAGGWLPSEISNKLAQNKYDFRKELEKILNDEENWKNLTVEEKDRLVEVGASILEPLIGYMDARKAVVANRAGLAPKNWKLDNELIWQAYKELMLKRLPIIAAKGDLILDDKGVWKIAEEEKKLADVGGEKLGDDELGYAIEGRTPLALKVMDAILRTSTYHILVQKDQRRFAGRGVATRARFEAARANLAAQPLPDQVVVKINNRVNILRSQGMAPRIDKATTAFRNLGYEQTAIDTWTSINWSSDLTKKILASGAASKGDLESLVNINQERYRLRDQYIDEQLHKTFVEEWPSRFADIASLPKAA